MASTRVPTGALARVGRACASHPWRTIAGWLVFLAALAGLAGGLGGRLANEFVIPGTDTQRALDLLRDRFPAQSGDTARLVFAVPEGQSVSDQRAVLERAVAAAKETPHATGATDPLAEGQGLSDGGRIAFSDVQFDKAAFDLPKDDVRAMVDRVEATVEGSPVQVEFTGQVLAALSTPEPGASELIGIGLALIVLLIVFGSVVAALIPIGLALLALFGAFSLLFIGASFTNINTITPTLVTMIGLGVGIDYSLFIVTRFRQALHDGVPPREAAALAQATAGRAVLFAGLTVAISIAGLALVGLDFLTKMGFGAALGVVTSVAIATTLLPAILALLGHRIDRLSIPGLKRDDSAEARHDTLLGRWGRFVTSRAGILFILGVGALIVIAAPVTQLQLGASDDGTSPPDTTGRKAYDLLSEGFGPGFNGPLLIAVDQTKDAQAAQKISDALVKTDGIAAAFPPSVNEAGDAAVVTAFPKTSPGSKATDKLVDRVRDEVIPQIVDGGAYVSGNTAAFKDIGSIIFSNLPKFLIFVIGVTFIVLTMAFRSVVVALKAAIATLVSTAAAFGILTFVLQLGHGMGLLSLDRAGPIESFLPPIVFGIVFGLSMDYEVFLMSRVREEHVHGKDTRHAVADGVGAIGRVIVAAALIMTFVFGAFILAPDRVSKEFGLFLAAAILIDALIVRMTIVPAILTLLGERSWAMPGWLDRILPRLTIEPPTETAEPLAIPALAAESGVDP